YLSNLFFGVFYGLLEGVGGSVVELLANDLVVALEGLDVFAHAGVGAGKTQQERRCVEQIFGAAELVGGGRVVFRFERLLGLDREAARGGSVGVGLGEGLARAEDHQQRQEYVSQDRH